MFAVEEIERRNAVLQEREIRESGGQKQWVWLSFADGDLPAGSQFLGVCLVLAYGIIGAVMEAHRLGINPGGEVAGWLLGPGPLPPDTIPPNRLCSLVEIEAAGPPVVWPFREDGDVEGGEDGK